MTIRFAAFIVLILATFFLPFWVFVVGAIMYGIFFTPYELLILAVCVDAVFGEQASGNVWYLYTLLTSIIVFCIACIKPYVRNSVL